jgi:predicted membrane protein
MDRRNRNFLGIIILVFGIIFLLQKLDILPVAIFFAGWWTLLLIIPALFSMSKQGVTVGNAVLLILGIFFFLNERGWNLSGFLMPAILIAIGIGLLLKRN